MFGTNVGKGHNFIMKGDMSPWEAKAMQFFMNTSLAALQTLALYTGATIVTLAKQTLTQK